MDDAELKEQELHDARMEHQRSERANLDEMRDLLSRARIRLDQYVGMCRVDSTTENCGECAATIDLSDRIRKFMRSSK